jgi:hypothetical protein
VSLAMMARLLLVALLAFPASPGGSPWDKEPSNWKPEDVYRILQDSPWIFAGVKLELEPKAVLSDPKTGRAPDGSSNPSDTNTIPGFQVSRSKEQPRVPVLWWSAKTVRLAQKRLRQLVEPGLAAEPLRAEELPDYVLVIQGREPLRILRDAKEDSHDTVFLELPRGATVDLKSVRFVEETAQEEERAEFHFPKQVEGRATVHSEAERVIFHGKASTKTVSEWRANALSLHAEFNPRAMRVRGVPDL